MYTKNKPSERGQAIVLIVLAMIALLGFTALAVDGSMVYSDRRWAQNAADASALAGAGAAAQYLENQGFVYHVGTAWDGANNSCAGVTRGAVVEAVAAAVARANVNDYNLATGITPEFGGVQVECGSEGPRKYMDVKVVVVETTDTAFAQVIFPGGLKNTVTAVARVIPSAGFAWGRSIVALNPNPCSGNQNGMQFFGLGQNSGNVYVDGGGLWSNNCLDVDNNQGNVTVDGGAVSYYQTANNYALGAINIINPTGTPILETDVNKRMSAEDYALPEDAPDCTGRIFRPQDILNWYQTHQNTGLPTGIYCIDGNLSIQGNDRVQVQTNDGTVHGTPTTFVTLVLTNGRLTINGGAEVNLAAPPNAGSYRDYNRAIPGLAIYAPPSNTNCRRSPVCMTINGGSDITIDGTILAPGTDATIVFDGTADTQLTGQIIGWNVDAGGSSGTSVTYDPNRVSTTPTYLNMQE